MIEYKAIRFTQKDYEGTGETRHTASLQCVNSISIGAWSKSRKMVPHAMSVDDEAKDTLISVMYDSIYGEHDDMIIEFYKLIEYCRHQINPVDPFGTDMTILDELAKINERHMQLKNKFRKEEEKG